jgi:hypothetical protein
VSWYSNDPLPEGRREAGDRHGLALAEQAQQRDRDPLLAGVDRWQRLDQPSGEQLDVARDRHSRESAADGGGRCGQGDPGGNQRREIVALWQRRRLLAQVDALAVLDRAPEDVLVHHHSLDLDGQSSTRTLTPQRSSQNLGRRPRSGELRGPAPARLLAE